MRWGHEAGGRAGTVSPLFPAPESCVADTTNLLFSGFPTKKCLLTLSLNESPRLALYNQQRRHPFSVFRKSERQNLHNQPAARRSDKTKWTAPDSCGLIQDQATANMSGSGCCIEACAMTRSGTCLSSASLRDGARRTLQALALLLPAVAVPVTAPVTAMAADDEPPHYGAEAGPWYLVGNLGMFAGIDSELESTGDLGYRPDLSFGGAVGYRISPIFRLEAELSYRQSELEDLDHNSFGIVSDVGGDLVMLSGMLNVIGDLPVLDSQGRWRPWIGAGLGYANAEMKGGEFRSGTTYDTLSGEDQNVAYQIMTGLDYAFSDRVMFGLGYRYWGMGGIDFNNSAGTNVEFDGMGGHEFFGRMRYHF